MKTILVSILLSISFLSAALADTTVEEAFEAADSYLNRNVIMEVAVGTNSLLITTIAGAAIVGTHKTGAITAGSITSKIIKWGKRGAGITLGIMFIALFVPEVEASTMTAKYLTPEGFAELMNSDRETIYWAIEQEPQIGQMIIDLEHELQMYDYQEY